MDGPTDLGKPGRAIYSDQTRTQLSPLNARQRRRANASGIPTLTTPRLTTRCIAIRMTKQEKKKRIGLGNSKSIRESVLFFVMD
jgi:hypothetical protein